MNRKSILVIVLSALLCLSTACGSSGGSDDTRKDGTSGRNTAGMAAQTEAETDASGVSALSEDTAVYRAVLSEMECTCYGTGDSNEEVEGALTAAFSDPTVVVSGDMLRVFGTEFPLESHAGDILSYESDEDAAAALLGSVQVGDAWLDVYLDDFSLPLETRIGCVRLLLYDVGQSWQTGTGLESEVWIEGVFALSDQTDTHDSAGQESVISMESRQDSTEAPDSNDGYSSQEEQWEGMIVPVPDDFDYSQSVGIAPEQPDGNVYPDAPANAAIGGAATLDEAVRIHYQAEYDLDPTEWLAVIPQGYIDTHENIAEKMDGWFTWIVPDEFLPGGMDSLTYTVEDLTADLTAGYGEISAMRSAFRKYGVDEIDGLWHIEADIPDGSENDTLIVRSQGRYFSTYALGNCMYAYDEDEDTDGMFY